MDEQQQQAVQQQVTPENPPLYAGKYTSVTDLEKAYVEAQKVISARQEQQQPKTDAPADTMGVQEMLIQAVSRNGSLSEAEEALAKHHKLDSALIQRAGLGERVRRDSFMKDLGGVDVVKGDLDWAKTNMPGEQLRFIQAQLESKDQSIIQGAISLIRELRGLKGGNPSPQVGGTAAGGPTSAQIQYQSAAKGLPQIPHFSSHEQFRQFYVANGVAIRQNPEYRAAVEAAGKGVLGK